MKVRNGFVTNSSSSSFILAYNDLFQNFDRETLEKHPILVHFGDFVREVLFSSNGFYESNEAIKVSSKEELDEQFKEECCWYGESLEKFLEEDKYYGPMYEKCIDALDRGLKILFKTIDYNDTSAFKIIDALIADGSFEVIKADD